MKVLATRRFSYKGKTYAPGDDFEVSREEFERDLRMDAEEFKPKKVKAKEVKDEKTKDVKTENTKAVGNERTKKVDGSK